jgi:hypothetical protein
MINKYIKSFQTTSKLLKIKEGIKWFFSDLCLRIERPNGTPA